MKPHYKILILDNYDSFTYNLYQQIAQVSGCLPLVVANDHISMAEIMEMAPQLIVISPGPGRPEQSADFGICSQVLDQTEIPVFGVCLGFQGMVWRAGGKVVHAPQPVHGRTSSVHHNQHALFAGIPQGFEVVRYHSLVVSLPLPAEIALLASTRDGLAMAVAHLHRPQWGIQFHPESVSTQFGDNIIRNVLHLAGLTVPAERAPLYRAMTLGSPAPFHYRRLTAPPPAEWVYRALFAGSAYHFWLDSSLERKGLSRFSFMGDHCGSGAYALTYDMRSQSLSRHDGLGSHVKQQSILDFMEDVLRPRTRPHPLPFPFQGGFVGYFGYELKGECGAATPHPSQQADAAFIYATRFIAYDHQESCAYLVSLDENEADAAIWLEQTAAALAQVEAPAPLAESATAEFRLQRDKSHYLRDIDSALQEIRDGNSYEVCLTNQISGSVSQDPVSLYCRLRRENPAPYASCLRFGELWVLSSSPEQFLRIDASGHVSSKPIKGTRARAASPQQDQYVIQELAAAVKDRSENLMIVDLLRNDLGKVCQVGSVFVPKLMEVETYATVHQLVSTVCGQLAPETSVINCLRAIFPGGSMTGTPKLRTMEIIDHLEGQARGVYSGCIGYLGQNGVAELSIVIRTAVYHQGRVTIGTGGAIVALSEASSEFDEILLKARALLTAFGAELVN